MVYLDNAATTPLLPCVKKAMRRAAKKFYGNASALHSVGFLATLRVEETRDRLARLINADSDEIIFTSGSTEANNTIINIFRGQSIAASTIEHESILLPARQFAQPFTPVDIDKNGFLCYNKDIWSSKPRLFSLMLASNELGTIQDIATWAKKIHSHNAWLHSDMTQCLGKIAIDVKKLGVDYATFSAHKIGGPIGVGALYVKKGAPFTPFLLGGTQEYKRRAGTYNTLGIIGFNAALEFIEDYNTPELYATKVAPLRDLLASRILNEIPYSSLNTPLKLKAKTVLPNLLNVSFQAAEGESIQLYLDAKGIAVATGSACAAGNGQPSHVLMAKTGDAEVAHSSIRFSFSLDNTKKDVQKVMSVLPDIVAYLQSISTIKIEKGQL